MINSHGTAAARLVARKAAALKVKIAAAGDGKRAAIAAGNCVVCEFDFLGRYLRTRAAAAVHHECAAGVQIRADVFRNSGLVAGEHNVFERKRRIEIAARDLKRTALFSRLIVGEDRVFDRNLTARHVHSAAVTSGLVVGKARVHYRSFRLEIAQSRTEHAFVPSERAIGYIKLAALFRANHAARFCRFVVLYAHARKLER